MNCSRCKFEWVQHRHFKTTRAADGEATLEEPGYAGFFYVPVHLWRSKCCTYKDLRLRFISVTKLNMVCIWENTGASAITNLEGCHAGYYGT